MRDKYTVQRTTHTQHHPPSQHHSALPATIYRPIHRQKVQTEIHTNKKKLNQTSKNLYKHANKQKPQTQTELNQYVV